MLTTLALLAYTFPLPALWCQEPTLPRFSAILEGGISELNSADEGSSDTTIGFGVLFRLDTRRHFEAFYSRLKSEESGRSNTSREVNIDRYELRADYWLGSHFAVTAGVGMADYSERMTNFNISPPVARFDSDGLFFNLGALVKVYRWFGLYARWNHYPDDNSFDFGLRFTVP